MSCRAEPMMSKETPTQHSAFVVGNVEIYSARIEASTTEGRDTRSDRSLMQDAIVSQENRIPANLVRGWSRDVQVARESSEVIEMLVRCYSLHGDGLHIFGFGADTPSYLFGRRVWQHNIEFSDQRKLANDFFDSAWFHRYIVDHEDSVEFAPGGCSIHIGPFKLIHGDARSALCSFDDNLLTAQ